jgi:hypothetical protein
VDAQKSDVDGEEGEGDEDEIDEDSEDPSGLHQNATGQVMRWYWQQDNGIFSPYNDAINATIELNYWALRSQPVQSRQFLTEPIVRFIDDVPQVYRVDFAQMRQYNAKTGYSRVLERKQMACKLGFEPNVGVWEFCDAAKRWRPYDSLCQDAIEQRYVAYASGVGEALVTNMLFPGRPELFTLNFVTSVQTNQVSKTVRGIRRVSIADRKQRADLFSETVTMRVKGGTDQQNVDWDDSGDLAKQVRSCVKSVVQSALGSRCDEWDIPIVLFAAPNSAAGNQNQKNSVSPCVITLTISGLAKSLTGLLVGRISTGLL